MTADQTRDGKKLDKQGFDKKEYHRQGVDKEGLDREGLDKKGLDGEGHKASSTAGAISLFGAIARAADHPGSVTA